MREERTGRKGKRHMAQEADSAFKCEFCGQGFPSKNKLFKHLKAGGECAQASGVWKCCVGTVCRCLVCVDCVGFAQELWEMNADFALIVDRACTTSSSDW